MIEKSLFGKVACFVLGDWLDCCLLSKLFYLFCLAFLGLNHGILIEGEEGSERLTSLSKLV